MKRLLYLILSLTALSIAPAWAQFPLVVGPPYLRADVGGLVTNDLTFHSDFPGAPTVTGGRRFVIKSGNSGTYGIGIGTRVSPLLRTDLTLSLLPGLGIAGADNVGNFDRANIQSLVGMVNVYLDPGPLLPSPLFGLEPYIDAGIGVASTHIGRLRSSGFPHLDHHTETSVAWAIGVGLAFPILPGIKVDLAYRYLDLGEVRTGTPLAGAGFVPRLKADIQTHSFTAGVRLNF